MRNIMKIKYLLFFLIHLLMLLSCSEKRTYKKVLILGIDGMDYNILSELLEEGKMPIFEKFIKKGDFKKLHSSIPPQSPVAWSNFITGKNPGGHGIFDFIHRNPSNLTPYLSTSITVPSNHFFSIGEWKFPLKSGKVELLRKGESFWKILEKHNIPSTVMKIPSNFPPTKSKCKTISGMGTPDLMGTYGEFTFYTDDAKYIYKEEITGGKIIFIEVIKNTIQAYLMGPPNIYRKDEPNSKVPFDIYIDDRANSIRIDVQNKKIILKEGELSEWIEIEFEMIPFISNVKGICKFMLTGINPHFGLYVSPININPKSPAMPISTPNNYAKELSKKIGFFYTQGMAEDTKALEYDILDLDDYLTQSRYVFEERKKMYRYFLKNWESGLLFFYFSTIDQNSHTLWWERDPSSVLFDEKIFEKYGDLVKSFYIELDDVLKETLENIGEDIPLIIMSDHGFAPYYKKFNLNSWLYEEGYIKMFREWNQNIDKYFQTVDWTKTKAYGLGINSLYINLKNRELYGIVNRTNKLNLMKEIKDKLLKVVDTETGKQIIKNVYITEELHPNSQLDTMPDIIIGYARGYRCSDESVLGEFPDKLLEINTDKWSSDHCMDVTEVPGIVISNKIITKEECYLYDLTTTILKEYGIDIPESMTGKPIY